MPRVIWSAAALRSLVRLHDFIEPSNKAAAQRAVRAIRQGVRILEAHPQVGRPIEPPDLREWPIGFGDSGYVVLYRFDGDAVVLLAIRHAKEADY